MKPQIIVKNVSKTYKVYIKENGMINAVKSFFNRKYKYIQAVKDISFTVNQGEILGLIGLNGAGKTTTIKLVSGIIKADKGIIRVLGKDPFLRSKEYRNKVSLVMGQKGQLDPDLSIIDSVKLFASIYSIDKKEAISRTKSMAEELNLSEIDLQKQVRTLSLGQRMKGELILSFIHLPVIVFLDEPTLGLDFITQRAIRNYLKNYKKKYNASIILTSHYITDIEDLCDNIYILHKGHELYYGTIDKLKSMVPNIRKVRFNASNCAIERISKYYKVEKADEEQEYFIRFNPHETINVMKILSNEIEVSNINFHDDTLDIIIESLYKGAEK
ncbi:MULTISPECIES: ABC transporter ATP-binding protein [Thermoanaerobacter]|uniref:ABC transporter related n=2 Tax=Thermoanaerobacter TaxID=1754 RepID=B0KCY3_THEP3|nr:MULTISPECIES: ATP-binding cassette domain-containing protein [Thermoanaerobacter]ABY94081.1 ABC transporter related [Thermoanaerobacter pseudethanolicus ATCC 33223]ADV79037.1 ABC transporter related protein [Thermoanaerobacter brockii subsp. finnii Ako-1]HBW59962.1 ABC transporter ATP-binding protein [Thermoanaerobacter sp.]